MDSSLLSVVACQKKQTQFRFLEIVRAFGLAVRQRPEGNHVEVKVEVEPSVRQIGGWASREALTRTRAVVLALRHRFVALDEF